MVFKGGFIRVSVKGADKVINGFHLLSRRMPTAVIQAGTRDLAKDIERGAKMRYSMYGFDQVEGYAYNSLTAKQIHTSENSSTWGIKFGSNKSKRYAQRLEFGLSIPGWHAVPLGGGRFYSRTGGIIPIGSQKPLTHFFLRDAFNSTRERARDIIERRIEHERDMSGLR